MPPGIGMMTCKEGNCICMELEKDDLRALYNRSAENNLIDPSLYARYRVKQGLRNENGTGVKVGLTRICDVVGYQMIHGHKHDTEGQLIYRGYTIDELVRRQKEAGTAMGYETTAFLLIFGHLPDEQELQAFRTTLLHNIHTDFIAAKYPTSNLLNAMQIEVLKMYAQDDNPDNDRLEDRMVKGLSILASLPLFVFSCHTSEKLTAYPLPDGSLAENILYMDRQGGSFTPEEANVLDILLMIHADHGGGNNSAFTDVVLTSTGTDIYSCISAAMGSLKGPKHGGAANKMAQMYDAILEETGITTDPAVLEDVCWRLLSKDFGDRSGLIYGIGHAIYTRSDPRARMIREACRQLAAEKGEEEAFAMMEALEQTACRVMKKAKGVQVCANVDFYSGFAYRMLGIEPELFVPLFAISRTAGWIAHHLENRQNNRKLIRPANIYVGERL